MVLFDYSKRRAPSIKDPNGTILDGLKNKNASVASKPAPEGALPPRRYQPLRVEEDVKEVQPKQKDTKVKEQPQLPEPAVPDPADRVNLGKKSTGGLMEEGDEEEEEDMAMGFSAMNTETTSNDEMPSILSSMRPTNSSSPKRTRGVSPKRRGASPTREGMPSSLSTMRNAAIAAKQCPATSTKLPSPMKRCGTSELVKEHRNRRPTTLVEIDFDDDMSGMDMSESNADIFGEDEDEDEEDEELEDSICLFDEVEDGPEEEPPPKFNRDASQIKETHDWSKPSRKTVDYTSPVNSPVRSRPCLRQSMLRSASDNHLITGKPKGLMSDDGEEDNKKKESLHMSMNFSSSSLLGDSTIRSNNVFMKKLSKNSSPKTLEKQISFTMRKKRTRLADRGRSKSENPNYAMSTLDRLGVSLHLDTRSHKKNAISTSMMMASSSNIKKDANDNNDTNEEEMFVDRRAGLKKMLSLQNVRSFKNSKLNGLNLHASGRKLNTSPIPMKKLVTTNDNKQGPELPKAPCCQSKTAGPSTTPTSQKPSGSFAFGVPDLKYSYHQRQQEATKDDKKKGLTNSLHHDGSKHNRFRRSKSHQSQTSEITSSSVHGALKRKISKKQHRRRASLSPPHTSRISILSNTEQGLLASKLGGDNCDFDDSMDSSSSSLLAAYANQHSSSLHGLPRKRSMDNTGYGAGKSSYLPTEIFQQPKTTAHDDDHYDSSCASFGEDSDIHFGREDRPYSETDLGYGNAAPDLGYGDAAPDQLGYTEAPPDLVGYRNTKPDDLGYGDAAPFTENLGYGGSTGAAPDRGAPKECMDDSILDYQDLYGKDPRGKLGLRDVASMNMLKNFNMSFSGMPSTGLSNTGGAMDPSSFVTGSRIRRHGGDVPKLAAR